MITARIRTRDRARCIAADPIRLEPLARPGRSEIRELSFIKLYHLSLFVRHLLYYEDLFDIPDRVREHAARRIITQPGVRSGNDVACDDRNDRRFFRHDALELVEGRSSLLRVRLTGLFVE